MYEAARLPARVTEGAAQDKPSNPAPHARIRIRPADPPADCTVRYSTSSRPVLGRLVPEGKRLAQIGRASCRERV